MKQHHRRTFVELAAGVVGTLFLALALTVPAQAQNVCATQALPYNPLASGLPGTGGTGAPKKHAATQTGGFGSTGMVAAVPGLGGTGAREGGIGGTGIREGGIGGTGIRSGGIGGTGIVGVITGFASICVNGLEVYFDASTPVSADGQPTTAAQLAVGQVVAVQAQTGEQGLLARNIAMVHAAVGPVDAVDLANASFTILGQTARVANRAQMATVRSGDWVRVSGHRLAQGTIEASHIEPISPQAHAQLNGSVSQVEAGGVRVEGTWVQLDAGVSADQLTPGMEVAISGQWQGGVLRADSLRTEPTRSVLGAVDHVVFEGYVHSLDGQVIDLGMGPLSINADTQMPNEEGKRLGVNERVQVSGHVQADGRVSVDRVERHQDNASSGRSDEQDRKSARREGLQDESKVRGKEDGIRATSGPNEEGRGNGAARNSEDAPSWRGSGDGRGSEGSGQGGGSGGSGSSGDSHGSESGSGDHK